MPGLCEIEQIRCRHCGKELVIFDWGTVVTACCSNSKCRAYKQPYDTGKTVLTNNDNPMHMNYRKKKTRVKHKIQR